MKEVNSSYAHIRLVVDDMIGVKRSSVVGRSVRLPYAIALGTAKVARKIAGVDIVNHVLQTADTKSSVINRYRRCRLKQCSSVAIRSRNWMYLRCGRLRSFKIRRS